jgi:glycosyltransferase involved in cell wall biosynthesis
MNGRKKCLVLTFQTPQKPGGGGEVRSWCLLKTACEVFDVTILNIGGMTGSGRVPEEIRRNCAMVIEPVLEDSAPAAARRTGRMAAWLSLVGALLFPWSDYGRPFLRLMLQYGLSQDRGVAATLVRIAVRFWTPVIALMPITCFMFDQSWRRIRDASISLATRERFDIFWVEHTLAWPFAEQLLELPGICDARIICSAQNIEHMVCERQRDVAVEAANAAYHDRQAKQMKRLELRAWRRADLVLQCSEVDANETKRHVPGARVEVIGNGVDGQYFQPIAATAANIEPLILYTAGFGYAPNTEAVRWFLQQVFPLVRQLMPQVRFLFAGAEAERFSEALAAEGAGLLDGVEWISDPPDIRPAFGRGLVYVVPLLCGGGSRLKILEAMSMRVPVVSTSVGAEGVPYEDGMHLLLADGAEAFAAAVVRLLQDAQLRQRLTEQAAEFVREAWDWSTLRTKLRGVLQKEFCQ